MWEPRAVCPDPGRLLSWAMNQPQKRSWKLSGHNRGRNSSQVGNSRLGAIGLATVPRAGRDNQLRVGLQVGQALLPQQRGFKDPFAAPAVLPAKGRFIPSGPLPPRSPAWLAGAASSSSPHSAQLAPPPSPGCFLLLPPLPAPAVSQAELCPCPTQNSGQRARLLGCCWRLCSAGLRRNVP